MAGRYVFSVMYSSTNPGLRLRGVLSHFVNTRRSSFNGLVTITDGQEATDQICLNYADLSNIERQITEPTFALLVVRTQHMVQPVNKPLFAPETPEKPTALPLKGSADIVLETSRLVVQPNGLPIFQGWLPENQGIVVGSNEADLDFFSAKKIRSLPSGKRITFLKKRGTITVSS